MKILMVIPSVSKKWGGTTTSIMNFYKGLTGQNIECHIVSTYTKLEKDDIPNEIQQNEDFFLFLTKINGWRYSKSLTNFLKSHIAEYDVVWIHALWTGTTYFASRYAKRYNVPYILTPHGMIEEEALKRKSLKKRIYLSIIEKKIFNNASAIHCITEQEEKNVKKISKTDTFVVPNGVSVGQFVKKEYSKLNTICFIGRIHPIKGLDLFLEAIYPIKNINIIIAGSGEKSYEDYIFSLIKQYKPESRIDFLGFIDNQKKKEVFKKSLFCIIPSHSEGLSMVGLESIANSTPILTTKNCNFDDISTYSAGMVMKDNIPSTIREYIVRMINSDIEKMSKNAYNLAIERYSFQIVAKKIIDNFMKLTE